MLLKVHAADGNCNIITHFKYSILRVELYNFATRDKSYSTKRVIKSDGLAIKSLLQISAP